MSKIMDTPKITFNIFDKIIITIITLLAGGALSLSLWKFFELFPVKFGQIQVHEIHFIVAGGELGAGLLIFLTFFLQLKELKHQRKRLEQTNEQLKILTTTNQINKILEIANQQFNAESRIAKAKEFHGKKDCEEELAKNQLDRIKRIFEVLRIKNNLDNDLGDVVGILNEDNNLNS